MSYTTTITGSELAISLSSTDQTVDLTKTGAQGASGLGITFREAWATSTVYNVNDVVVTGGSAYICIVDHTSGTFATDLADANWYLMVEAGAIPTLVKADITDFSDADYEPADATILKDADIGVTVQAYSAVLAGTTASFTTANETKLDGIETGADVTDSGNVNPLVDTHLNTGTASSGEVLSWTGSDYDWITAGGGASDIDGLSDGYSAGQSVGLGSGALANDDGTTNKNTAVGFNAGDIITTGTENVLIGDNADVRGVGHSQAIAIGAGAIGGYLSVNMGYLAGGSISTNSGQTVFIGYNAGRYTNNSGCVGIGYSALKGSNSLLMSGVDNIGIGRNSGIDLTTGDNNFLGGYQAGINLTTGADNVAIGKSAGETLTTGRNNTIIGHEASSSTATVSNEITLGDSSIATLRSQVTTITSLSDARDKTDIQPLNAGLEFVEALNPVSFTWNMRDGGKVGEADTGFIAQDLKQVQEDLGVHIPHLVYEAGPDRLEAGYGKLLPILVQAIKDLSEKVDELETRLVEGN